VKITPQHNMIAIRLDSRMSDLYWCFCPRPVTRCFRR